MFRRSSYVTSASNFTSDAQEFKRVIARLKTLRNRDDAEAQLDGLNEALSSEWGPNAMRIVILITDSAPHGIERIVRKPRNRNVDLASRGCPCGM